MPFPRSSLHFAIIPHQGIKARHAHFSLFFCSSGFKMFNLFSQGEEPLCTGRHSVSEVVPQTCTRARGSAPAL